MKKHRPIRAIAAAMVVAVLLATQFATAAFAASDSNISVAGYIGTDSGSGGPGDPGSDKPDPGKPNPGKPNPDRPGPDRPDRPNPVIPDPEKPGAVDPDPAKPVPGGSNPIGGGLSPKTGDETSLPLYTFSLLSAMILFIFLLGRIRKEYEP